jgi:natural product biosynthesis luciferase-like monooxygenase protein
MEFSIMLWGDANSCKTAADSYTRILQIAEYADNHQYTGIWLPERHFHPWGGLHPNPSVLAAALATSTERVKLRAGSVVLPLHDPIRVAEEWSVVDNLSHGRVELAFATGWKDDDFVLAPERFKRRKQDVWESIDQVRRLWRGEPHSGPNGKGLTVSISTFPRPVQPELPIWITSSGSLRTITNAGNSGYNLITHLLGQDYGAIREKVNQYRAHRVRGGIELPGRAALMIHTFLGADGQDIKEFVRTAMSSYLLDSADLSIPYVAREEWKSVDDRMKMELAEVAFDRYFESASLMGTVESCKTTVKTLVGTGVDEACCLIDFGLPLAVVHDHLKYLTELKDWCADAGL